MLVEAIGTKGLEMFSVELKASSEEEENFPPGCRYVVRQNNRESGIFKRILGYLYYNEVLLQV